MPGAKSCAVPLILSQHFSPADRVYADAEGSLYHYPQVYFKRVQPYELFIYYSAWRSHTLTRFENILWAWSDWSSMARPGQNRSSFRADYPL